MRWNLNTSSPRTMVWPALLPPWKRITRSACSASRSTTFPFPSSPHWAPTMTTPGMAKASVGADPLERAVAGAVAGRGRWHRLRAAVAVEVRQLRILRQERERHLTDRPVPVLGDDHIRLTK